MLKFQVQTDMGLLFMTVLGECLFSQAIAFPLNPSSPYVQSQAELEQIQKLKWIASEKDGREVGFERALMEWVGKYRQQWRKDRNKASAKN